MFKKASLIVLAFSLYGCAGLNYVMENYNGVPQQNFTSSTGLPYRIFDKPDESRLMITPSLAASAAHGAVKGVTLGMASPAGELNPYEKASLEFLSSKGKSCSITSSKVVYDPQVEIRYICATHLQ